MGLPQSRRGRARFATVAALLTVMAAALTLPSLCPIAGAFRAPHPPPAAARRTASTSLHMALNRQNKFNKQNALAAKMAAAQKQRAAAEGGAPAVEETEEKKPLSAKEIKLRNDQKRFADLLDNSLGSGGDFDKGYYLTENQENENADAVFRGVERLYEGDPAPTAPFAQLCNIENGEPLGKGGMTRLVPWEGSHTNHSADYLVVITDPRPKSAELRTAVKQLAGALTGEALGRCVVINTDTAAENRRFLKKNLGEDPPLRVLVDPDKGWMRAYTALGEKRYSITVFVLRGEIGRAHV